MSAEVITLGCRLNLSESEALRGLLAAERDLVVVNSCAVTTEAVRQTRRAIRRARRKRPGARLLVTGCGAEVERDALGSMPEVDGLVPNASKLDQARYLPGSARRELVEGPSLLPAAEHSDRREEQPFDKLRADGVGGIGAHTRAFVQVQNGCDHACTFCVIPQGRGPSRSHSARDVAAEIERHIARGVREVVLTGVDLTDWGSDLPGAPRLGALVSAILRDCPRLERLRLSSLDGIEVDPELFELIAGEPRVMPHVHLSLQSGDDLVLKRMKRRHLRGDAVRLVEGLRARRGDISIGADLIAGFPTEDEAMHGRSLAIVAELGVVHGHVFPYSPRPGTPAARMPQVERATLRRRAGELREAVAAERRRWLHGLIGTPQRVLAERDGTGHAENFAPMRLPGGVVVGEVVELAPTQVVEGLLA